MKWYKLTLCIFCCLAISFCFTQDAITEEIGTEISNTEVSLEVDELERRLREGFERENSPEYKAQQEAEVDSLEEQFRKSIEQVEAPEYKDQQEDEVDGFVEQMRKSKRLRESPEYKAQQEAEMKARIQQLEKEAEKQEKIHQQSYKGPFGSIFDLFKSHPILGILVVIVAVIYLNIRDYYKKLKNRPW